MATLKDKHETFCPNHAGQVVMVAADWTKLLPSLSPARPRLDCFLVLTSLLSAGYQQRRCETLTQIFSVTTVVESCPPSHLSSPVMAEAFRFKAVFVRNKPRVKLTVDTTEADLSPGSDERLQFFPPVEYWAGHKHPGLEFQAHV